MLTIEQWIKDNKDKISEINNILLKVKPIINKNTEKINKLKNNLLTT